LTSQSSGAAQFNNFVSDANSFQAEYTAYGTAQAVGLKSDTRSYFSTMINNGNLTGGFNGFIPARNGEIALAAGFVDQKLYYYGNMGSLTGAKTGVQIATIRTYADGHTELNPSAVPIPAAAYLFGTGLLGLVGIRRKMAA
jgi:hypothetical protein